MTDSIWLYCLFGNEERLMPYFLRHYSPQVDRLVMLDGNSTDGTRRLIHACPNAEAQDSPFMAGGYDEHAFVDYLSMRCREAAGQADWVIAVDVDEFLYAPIGLRCTLDAFRKLGVRAVKATGYQMTCDHFPEGDGQLIDLVRMGTRDPEYDKLVAFDPSLPVVWSPGRHNQRIGTTVHQPGMKLLHYRYFGEAYLAERNARNFARRSEADITAGRGYHGSPDHQGKYSLGWWQLAEQQAEEVIP